MPVITPRPTGHNAQRWSGIIGAMVVENKGFKGIHSNQHHLVHAYHRITHCVRAEMAHSMRETSELLDSVCMQIDSADVTAPMRVMGLRAGPPAISLTISLAALTVSYVRI